ncbi:hypothetical protein vseg_019028 [Gypsophila vaccaria]
MRIRKNAEKLIERKSSYLICQLNRTPWDDASFLSQGFWDNDLGVNKSADDIILMTDSVPTGDGDSTEYGVNNSHSPEIGRDDDDDDEIGGTRNVVPTTMLPPPGPPPLPPRNGASSVPKKRGRPRKPVHGASLGNNSNSNSNSNNNNNNNNNINPYEFYYYSGFGPSWGKRRGGTRPDPTPDPSNCNGNGNGNGNDTPGCSSTTRESNMSEDDEIIMVTDDDDKKGNSKGVIESFDSVLAAERELDYIEDEEDEDDVEMFGGKRARKPIKARSLKSLM